jgi:hypothetical protein
MALRPVSDTAVVRIYNESNELIRTLRVRTDTGFNRAYWGYEMGGTRSAVNPFQSGRGGGGGGGGRFGGAARGAEPPGLPVYPGTYKMVITLKGVADSTMMVVKPDPNVPISKELYDARMKVLRRIEKSTAKLVL